MDKGDNKGVAELYKMLKKGFIFTLDAVLALLVMVAFLGIIAHGGSDEPSKYNLRYYARDSLTILEKDHSLSDALDSGSESVLQEYLDSLPINICGEITLYDRNSVQLLNASKGCSRTSEVFNSRRVLIHKNEPYLAVMEVWYR